MGSAAERTGCANAADSGNFELRARILRTVYELVEEIPFDKLSISLICDRVGISRPTFYRYFSDRNEVCNWFIRTTLNSSLTQLGILFSWHEALLRFCRAMDANCPLVTAFFASRQPFSPYAQFVTLLQDSLSANAEVREAEAGEEALRRRRFQATAFARSFAAALSDWLEAGGSESLPIDDFVALAVTIVPSELLVSLDGSPDGAPFSEASRRAADRSPLIEFVADAAARG